MPYREPTPPLREEAREELARLAAEGHARLEEEARARLARDRRRDVTTSLLARLGAAWDGAARALQARQSASRFAVLTRKRVLAVVAVVAFVLQLALGSGAHAALGALGAVLLTWCVGLVAADARLRERRVALRALPFAVDRYEDVTGDPYWDGYSGLWAIFLRRLCARVYVVVQFADPQAAPSAEVIEGVLAAASAAFRRVADVAVEVTSPDPDDAPGAGGTSPAGRALIADAQNGIVVRFEARGGRAIREHVDRLVQRALLPLHAAHPIARVALHPFHPDPGD